MILFVNACVRQESRTRRLALGLLEKAGRPYEEVDLGQTVFPIVDEPYLLFRESLVKEEKYHDPALSLGKQFANADEIVIAAPFWDLSFPALLKQYFEQINVVGVTFRYTEEGRPEGLCRAGKLTYVTTAGGTMVPEEYGFGYVRALAQNFYGIPDVRRIMAAGLDLAGADADAILRDALEENEI